MCNGGPPSPLSNLDVPQLNPALVIASETLFPGQNITVSGEVISLPATSTGNVLINGSPPSPVSNSNVSRLNPTLVIASETLFPGQKITVSGEVISLPATGRGKIVVGDRTESLMRIVPTGTISKNFAVSVVDGTSVTAVEATAVSVTSAASAAKTNAGDAALSGPPSESSSALDGNNTNTAGGAASTVATFRNFAVENIPWEAWMGVWISGLGLTLYLGVGL